jgi:hypothetical protein
LSTKSWQEFLMTVSFLEEDAPYFDELVDGSVGALQNALFDADLDEEANIIEQIMWKLVNKIELEKQ